MHYSSQAQAQALGAANTGNSKQSSSPEHFDYSQLMKVIRD